MKRQRALDTYRVSRAGSKEQLRQGDTPARDSVSDSSKLLTSESMLEVEGEEVDEDDEEGEEADEAEWCSTWCI